MYEKGECMCVCENRNVCMCKENVCMCKENVQYVCVRRMYVCERIEMYVCV